MVGLWGAGGDGKTTIARALCHDEGIQEALDDGILWVTLGEDPSNIISILSDLIYALSHEKPVLDTLDAAANYFSELLGERDILFVIDDVWDIAHLKPLLQGGDRCAHLITTRNERVLPSEAERIKVDAMQTDEAIALLSTSLEYTISTSASTTSLQFLARRLGNWPLLLKLVNGVLRDRAQSGETLDFALKFINNALDEEGLTAFDDENAQAHHRTVAKTLGISLQHLKLTERERYQELAIFPEDIDIPLITLAHFWKATGGISRTKVELLCQHLAQLSLLLKFDLATRTIRLHDVIRSYLRQTMTHALVNLNRQFLDSYNLTRWSMLPHDELYLWHHLANHLIDAERVTELLTTVKDGTYLATKAYLCRTNAVEMDIAIAKQHDPSDTSLLNLEHLLSGISHLLNQCSTYQELAATLHAYLLPYPRFAEIRASIESELERPFLSAWHPLPDEPSQELIRTLPGHTNAVNACAISPGDGAWIAPVPSDETLKLWDISHRSGTCYPYRVIPMR